jgi:hypothetical protein
MAALTEFLREHPEVPLFAALALGLFLGQRKVEYSSRGPPSLCLVALPLLLALGFAPFQFVGELPQVAGKLE